MSYLIKPAKYTPQLDMQMNEIGMKQLIALFHQNLYSDLRLRLLKSHISVL